MSGTVQRRMFEIMALTRAADERLRKAITAGEALLTYWPSRGQEAIAAALGVVLRREDWLVTTYRGLHDQIAKGVPVVEIYAEGLGRVAGASGGKGGTMHIADPDVGLMLTTGIVGAGVPVGTGLGLAAKLRGDGRVAAVSFGDGAMNQGAFHEAVNLAAVWQLPVVFVCQNNLYAECTPVGRSTLVTRLADRASAYGIPGVHADGNDPEETKEALEEAVQRARAGSGPTLVECETYRFFGHYFGDSMRYMPSEELETRRHQDPVTAYRTRLEESGLLTPGELDEIEEEAARSCDAALAEALASPLTDPASIDRDVYAEGVR
jgi:acetoin:2,6-dichlorophenolindophenol oxidoreductase subunit alpha